MYSKLANIILKCVDSGLKFFDDKTVQKGCFASWRTNAYTMPI